jgi:hypothetical protein
MSASVNVSAGGARPCPGSVGFGSVTLDKAKFAENAVVLAAHVAGVSWPASSIIGLFQAFRGSDTEVEAFVRRLVDEIEAWSIAHSHLVGGQGEGWKDRLIKGMGGDLPMGEIDLGLLRVTAFSEAATVALRLSIVPLGSSLRPCPSWSSTRRPNPS